MRCSRVAFPVLMAVLGGVVLALGPATGRRAVANECGPEPPPYMDNLGHADELNSATDRHDDDASQGSQSSPVDQCEADSTRWDGVPAAEAENTEAYHDGYSYDAYRANYADGNEELQANDDASEKTENACDNRADDVTDTADSAAGDDAAMNDNANDNADADADAPMNDNADDNAGADAPMSDNSDNNSEDNSGDNDQDMQGTEPNTEAPSEPAPESAEQSEAGAQEECRSENQEEAAGPQEPTPAVPIEQDGENQGYVPEFSEQEYSYEGKVCPEPGYPYEYSYPREKYGYDNGMDSQTESAAETNVEQSQDSSSEADQSQTKSEFPYDYKYEPYRESYNNCEPSGEASGESNSNESAAPSERSADGVDLSAFLPSELLTAGDQDLLRKLAHLFEEPRDVRQHLVSEYLEGQGSEVTALASRLEDVTGTEAVNLVDDLPGLAALLAGFRLVERDDLDLEQAADWLQRSLENLSEQWIGEVNAITAEETEDPPADGTESGQQTDARPTEHPTLLGVVRSWAAESVAELGVAIRNMSLQVAGLNWETSDDAAEQREATHVGLGGDQVQF